MKSVILLANPEKPAAEAALLRVRSELARYPIRIVVAQDGLLAEASDTLMLVVFGGDGTLLAAARSYAATSIPILPIHVGRFGFITESDSSQVSVLVENALNNTLEVHTRAMLSASVWLDDRLIATSPAVNDVVVAGSTRRLVDLTVLIDDLRVATYAADGVIVASPTGSTGYALSAGGPLVHPDVQAILITPIAAHTLSARSLLIPTTSIVCLEVPSAGRGSVDATIDGQVTLAVPPGGRVTIQQNPAKLTLVKGTGMTFYAKVTARWGLGERRNATVDNTNSH